MKKYVKPELFFESFELSQQIAACDYDSNNTLNDENCRFTGVIDGYGLMTIFLTVDVCGHDDGDPTNGPETVVQSYCYHNSSSGFFGIFNS